MITTFNAMPIHALRRSFAKALIIGFAATLLAGCTALRLGYNNAPQLAFWWLDGYADFTREQSPVVHEAIDSWFAWHRATQLPRYATLLASAQRSVLEPATPASMCAWQARVREVVDPALDRALLQAAELLPRLAPAQLRHIEQRYAKQVVEMREKYLQPDPAERRREALKRAYERAEQFYGRLEDGQRRAVEAGVAASPFDPAAWIAEREVRHRDTLQTLRKLIDERADRDQRVAALNALADRYEKSPTPTYRALQQRVAAHQCALAAQLHNAATPAQRQRARERLAGWEEDVRVLAGSAAPAKAEAAETMR